ncbi:MAG: MFS transporter [Lysobacteraceae bacterium]|nr:MAG: MFS transporter [Xanthomonadaceae bacterium]
MAKQWSERRTITAGVVGNVLEWYDFGVYGFFASVIATQFFPSHNPMLSLIAAFGAFAAGFLMRPVGAAIFGHIGDRYGRGHALKLSVLCMAVPTFCIGLLPTFETWGVMAAVLMVLMRMAQGVAVGGEYTSSIVFLAERAPPGRRAFFTCWSMFGATGGILLGSAVGALLSSLMSPEALNDWGWRVAFLAGIAVAGMGYFIRRGLEEHPVAAGEKSPLVEAVRNHGRALAQVIGLNVVLAVTFYLMFVYAVTWMIKNVGEARSTALDINTMAMLVLLAALPLSARLADAFGRKRMMLLGIGATAVLAYPLVSLMHHPNALWIASGQIGFALLVAVFASSIPATMTESFPRSVRVTAVSVSYNLTFAVLGGTSPMVAVWLIERSHDDLAFAWYISAAAVVSFLCALKVTDRGKLPLD